MRFEIQINDNEIRKRLLKKSIKYLNHGDYYCSLFSFSTAIAVDEPLRGLHGAPIINPFDQVTIEVNTDMTIECKANKPITWISELINGQNVNAESFAISLDDRSVFKSNLEFHAITANSVGRYYCVFNDSVVDSKMKYDDEVAAYMASSIYIFVDGNYFVVMGNNYSISPLRLIRILDPDTLIVPMEHTMIVATQNKATTIPCKPTSPNVNLELIKEDGEVITMSHYEIGFVVSESKEGTHLATCVASFGEQIQEESIVYEVTRRCL